MAAVATSPIGQAVGWIGGGPDPRAETLCAIAPCWVTQAIGRWT